MDIGRLKNLQVEDGLASDVDELSWLDGLDLDHFDEIEQAVAKASSEPALSSDANWVYFSVAMTTENLIYFFNGDLVGHDREGTCEQHVHWVTRKESVSGGIEVIQDKPCKSMRMNLTGPRWCLGSTRVDTDIWYNIRTSHVPSHHRGFRWATYTDDWIKRELLTGDKSAFKFTDAGNGWYNVHCKNPSDRVWQITHVGSNAHIVTGQKDRGLEPRYYCFKAQLAVTPQHVTPDMWIVEGTESERLRVEADSALLRYAPDNNEPRERFQFIHEGVLALS